MEREKWDHPERTLETPQQIALTTEWSAYLNTPEGKLLNVVKAKGDPAHQKMVNFFFEYNKEICKTVHCDCNALKNYIATSAQKRRQALISTNNSNKVNNNQWNFFRDDFWKTKPNLIYPQGACPETPPPADGFSDRLKRFWPF
ncbi:MAG: hypothetical protein Q7T66_07115 [Herminiimonas sp.]|uniref:hypothetical protein n=1 Tax=Herminiimonas sp. TaxID=1926289 RepID=UPI002728572E|nr:hypothetical protein [Herminiimonas sp.]MDO9420413.1 hypothetical protein [Herminiimonas sp.]